MTSLSALKVKLFADGADLDGIRLMAALPHIQGFTTNPTLMRKAGVTDYKAFALQVLEVVGTRPISFEVFADERDAMERQARAIAAWGPNVYVKIPVTNTLGQSSAPLIRTLSQSGVQLNVTAIMTLEQVAEVAAALDPKVGAVVSVFAGRIADTGRDPIPVMRAAKALLAGLPKAELLWASPRELLNVIHADESGCDIITATNDILSKLTSLEKDLTQFSLETVKMFYNDAKAASYAIAF